MISQSTSTNDEVGEIFTNKLVLTR